VNTVQRRDLKSIFDFDMNDTEEPVKEEPVEEEPVDETDVTQPDETVEEPVDED